MMNSTKIGVGFGTAGLGGNTYQSVQTALSVGFRKFDTAEADWWYDQPSKFDPFDLRRLLRNVPNYST